jgi:hypothetical protein
MKDIIDQINKYKSLTSTLQNSSLMKNIQLQKSVLEHGFLNTGVSETIFNHQKQIKNILGRRELSSLSNQFNNTLNPFLSSSLITQKNILTIYYLQT